MGLLCRDPGARLSGPEALRRLARDRARRVPESARRFANAVRRPRSPAPGAERGLPRRSSGGRAAVSVCGPSGIGKSALVRRFLGQFGERATMSSCSRGRCYENESVPYKALDGVCRRSEPHLASIPHRDVESLLPPDVAALTRVFPVLLQVRAIARLRRDQARNRRSVRLRRRGVRGVARAARTHGGAARSSSASTTCSGPTPTARCCSRSCCGRRSRRPCSRCCAFRSEEDAAKPFLRALLERAGRDIWSRSRSSR